MGNRRNTLERKLENRTVDELKSYLRFNNQPIGGTKAELVCRVADGAIFGVLPLCPRCGGSLHQEAMGTPNVLYRCRKLNREHEPCGYVVGEEELVRTPFRGAEHLL